VQRNDPARRDMDRPTFPVAAQPFITVVAVDEYEIDSCRTDLGIRQSVNARCTYPSNFPVSNLSNFSVCDDLLNTKTEPAAKIWIDCEQHSVWGHGSPQQSSSYAVPHPDLGQAPFPLGVLC
jgi:hypothetical protein